MWTINLYDISGNRIAEMCAVQNSGSSGGVKYNIEDWQGSTRLTLEQNGTIEQRTDYTAYGEEINGSIGMRTQLQGYQLPNANPTNNASQYAQTSDDKATGLDHTWFRKLENKAGRWTSPDPYNGSAALGSSSSFNRYSYVKGQPHNFVDPSGLLMSVVCWWTESWDVTTATLTATKHCYIFDDPIGVSFTIWRPFDIGDDLPLMIGGAYIALGRETCRQLFNDNVDPRNLLVDLVERGNVGSSDLGGIKDNKLVYAETTPIFKPPIEFTKSDGSIGKRHAGVASANIKINSNPAAATYRNLYGRSNLENSIITMIHEVGHAADFIYGDSASSINNDQDNVGTSKANSDMVNNNCL